MEFFQRTSSGKRRTAGGKTAWVIGAILLMVVFPFQTVSADPGPPLNLPLKILILKDGGGFTKPALLWFRCGYNSTIAFSTKCVDECQVTIPHQFAGVSCELLIAPEGEWPVILSGLRINYTSDVLFGVFQGRPEYHTTIDIGQRSCRYTQNEDKNFSVSGCSAITGKSFPENTANFQFPTLFFQAYLLTLFVEFLAVSFLIQFIQDGPEIRTWKIFLSVAVINLFTLPVVWLVVGILTLPAAGNYIPGILFAEFLAVSIEALWYQKLFFPSIQDAVKISVAANAVSYIVGGILLGF